MNKKKVNQNVNYKSKIGRLWSLSTKAIKSTPGALKGVDNIESSHGFTAGKALEVVQSENKMRIYRLACSV